MILPAFHPAVARWFQQTFEKPTVAQAKGWREISGGRHTLIEAPTGSGKTLAAFLWCLNDLVVRPPEPGRGVTVLYVSPLKALNNDIRRNLEMPLDGIGRAAAELDLAVPAISVDVRTGDTAGSVRARQIRRPPDVLITTPESLYLLITAGRSQAMFRDLRYVIVDEIHALAGTKRGTHLALSLERLEEMGRDGEPRPESDIPGRESRSPGGSSFLRIGLSATVKPRETAARLLAGRDDDGSPRPVSLVQAGQEKAIQLEVTYPLAGQAEDLDFMEHAARLVLEESRKHRSTLVFCNARHTCERLAELVNQVAGEQIALAHHGSIARERRFEIEQDLKEGRLSLLVATSSLELGIDIGSVDYVVQLASPRSVARALQRLGRSGHGVGQTSRGQVIARFPSDLLDAAACARGVKHRDIENTRLPHACLDVLTQHVVAMAGTRPRSVDELLRIARRAEPFHDLSRRQLENLLAMLDGRFADVRFTGLNARVVWDEEAGEVQARPGALRTALLNGGTIPDRGYLSVEVVGEGGEPGKRLGELDEEFAGELYLGGRSVFALGTSSWAVEAVDRDRVLVRPAPGEASQIPFWRGERLERPVDYGAAALAREIAGRLRRPDEETIAWLREECSLDEKAAAVLLDYVRRQEEATGQVPHDRAVVIETFPDEIGDGRLVIHSLFGGRVNGAWAFALKPRLREALGGIDPMVLYNDDGIIIRLPQMDREPPFNILNEVSSGTVEELLIGELADAPMLALRFREAAQRALLLPKANPKHRTPLWLRRQRAADLLSVVRRKAGFPVLQEAVRECLHDTWDLNGLRSVLRGIEAGEISLVFRETRTPSPFAAALVWDFGVAFQEAGDVPRGECRAAYLALNRDLLRETLESENLRDLLDPHVISEVEAELERQAQRSDQLEETSRLRAQAVAASRQKRDQARSALLHRAVQFFGPLTAGQVAQRLALDAAWTEHQLDVMVEAGQLSRGEYRPGGSGLEYCTPAILAKLHRESLRRVREQIAPVDGARYAAFLPAWQQIGSASAPRQPLRALRPLLRLPMPRDRWTAVLRARFGWDGIPFADTVTSRGDLQWRGAGGELLELVEPDDPPRRGLARPEGPAEEAVRVLLARRGAAFSSELARRLSGEWPAGQVQDALAALLAAGEIANDLFSGRGRWSLVEPGTGAVSRSENRTGPTDNRDLESWAGVLLDRYGVVAREMARAEKGAPRWSELERVYRTWEWRGRVLRGNFVRDLSGPQFALREAVDLLRESAPLDGRVEWTLLAWEDPASTWGKILPYAAPRGKGRFILLRQGVPAVIGAGWGRQIHPGPAWAEEAITAAAGELTKLARLAPEGIAALEQWQASSVLVSPFGSALRQAGFVRTGTRLVYRQASDVALRAAG